MRNLYLATPFIELFSYLGNGLAGQYATTGIPYLAPQVLRQSARSGEHSIEDSDIIVCASGHHK